MNYLIQPQKKDMMAEIMLKSFAKVNLVMVSGSNLRIVTNRLACRLFSNTPRRQNKVFTIRRFSNEVDHTSGTPSSIATHKPTPFQQKILVWAKMYPSVDKVPDRVSRGQIKKAMDIFRVRSSIIMAALVLVFAAMMAMIGRKQRHDGLSVTKIALERRQHQD